MNQFDNNAIFTTVTDNLSVFWKQANQTASNSKKK